MKVKNRAFASVQAIRLCSIAQQMHQRTCGWQPVIQPGSHIDKAVKKEKWKAMQESEERIAIGEDIMQKVVEAKYLGQIMSADGTTISDVRTRLAIATTKFTKLKWMWANEKISQLEKSQTACPA